MTSICSWANKRSLNYEMYVWKRGLMVRKGESLVTSNETYSPFPIYSITCIQRPLKGSNESGLLQQMVHKCKFY